MIFNKGNGCFVIHVDVARVYTKKEVSGKQVYFYLSILHESLPENRGT